jgi:DNA-binding beta-propeller fold protein YncE
VTYYSTLAYDTGTGDLRWVAREHATGAQYPIALAVSPDGTRVVVTGSGLGAGFSTVSYDAATGARQWAFARWPTGYPQALTITPDGATVLITGEGCGRSGDVTTRAYDAATGRREWVVCYDSGRRLSDQGNDLAVSPDGTTVFVTGSSDQGGGDTGNLDDITLAYTVADGHQIWERRWDTGSVYDIGEAIGVSPDGRTVYITARGVAPTIRGGGYVTFAYDAANGTPLARAAIGPGDPTSLAISPDGSTIYETGWFGRLDPLYFGTVAYRALP